MVQTGSDFYWMWCSACILMLLTKVYEYLGWDSYFNNLVCCLALPMLASAAHGFTGFLAELMLCQPSAKKQRLGDDSAAPASASALQAFLGAAWAFQPSKKRPRIDGGTAAAASSTTAGQPGGAGAKGQGKKTRGSLSSIQVPTAPAALTKAKKKPGNAPIEICVYKYTEEAQDLVRSFPAGVPAWAILLSHEAYPNVETQTLSALQAYLAAAHATNPDMPQDLAELRRDEDIIFILSRKGDYNNENMPIIEWAPVFYVAGDGAKLLNTLAFVSNFLEYRVTHPVAQDRSPWPALRTVEVNLHPHTGVVLAGAETLFQQFTCTLHDAAAVLPRSVFVVAPPGNVRAILVELEVVDDHTVIVAWDGKTYDFRARLNAAGIPRTEDNLRILQQERRDVAVEENQQFLFSVFEEAVFRSHVCHLTVTGVELADATPGPAQTFLETLKAKPYIFTAPW